MNSATRLYERLDQIPQDPSDPESLEDLVVCAFGAFERYYVCWRNRGGEYKQDGYDLPQSLQEWLFPPDGSTRDLATLQVVFGRGEEFFASDKDGKLECKEPEAKKPDPLPIEPGDRFDKPNLRRSRTTSFIRRSSDLSSRPLSVDYTAPESVNQSGATGLGAQHRSRSNPTLVRPASDPTPAAFDSASQSPIQAPTSAPSTSIPSRRKSRPLSMSFSLNMFPKIVEGKPLSPSSIASDWTQATKDTECCTCTSHRTSLPPSTYVDASIQTEPDSGPPTALRVGPSSDTSPFPSYNYDYGFAETEPTQFQAPVAVPMFMGRMMDYFHNPGYRLGDSLQSMYYSHQPSIYEDEKYYDDTLDYDNMERRQTV
ncbi:hypothetical protein EJ04DRAFT_559659 [Polyplosphaeria fusca]|uniref:Uncharacterized protein n=1 Tax=Polyplosphaeria fusca TaxID=682080 RepID=A0A9P4R608_9PLEO|nr:hypothetical protein EJ04DRAFT_559659 [Polyplosphaeria fusca]